MHRIRSKVGDVIAIPLSSGHFAFGRILHDEGLAVYDCVSNEISTIQHLNISGVKFYVYFFKTSVVSGAWPIIGHVEEADPIADWPPPMFVADVINPSNLRIYDRGEIRQATAKEVAGLEQQRMWYPVGLIAEIERRFGLHNN